MWPFSTKAAPLIAVEEKSDLTDEFSESWATLLGPFAIIANGVSVSAASAMRVPAVNCAVRTIAETVATLPAKVFKTVDDSKEPDEKHVAYPLVNGDANDWHSAGKVRELVTIDAILWGDGFAWVNKFGGKPTEIIHLKRSQITVEWSDIGEPKYIVGTEVKPSDEIIHIQAPSIDGERGMGLISAGRDAISLAILLERASTSLVKNGSRPSGILSFKGMLKPDALKRAGEAWKAAHGGSNSGGTAPLDNDAKYTPVAFTSVDSQHQEQRVFSIGEISRLTRVPVTMLQDLSNGTVSNTEQQNLQFLQLCLLPWLRAWTDAYRRCLLTKDERGDICVDFLVDDLLRGDSQARAQAYQQYRAAGVMTANDVRRKEGLPALPDGNTLSSPFTTAGTPKPANDNSKPTEAAA
jgi:HK97 family phage portal protein